MGQINEHSDSDSDSDLRWNATVDTIVSKTRKRVFTIYQLQRAGIRQRDLLRVYVSVMERGSSVVECRTRNQVSPGSNPLCYRFEDWAFSFSPLTPQLTQLYK